MAECACLNCGAGVVPDLGKAPEGYEEVLAVLRRCFSYFAAQEGCDDPYADALAGDCRRVLAGEICPACRREGTELRATLEFEEGA